MEKFEEAIKIYDKCLKIDANDADSYAGKGSFKNYNIIRNMSIVIKYEWWSIK